MITLIANKKGDLRLDIAEPKRGLIFTNVQWQIKYPTELINFEKQKSKLLEAINEINDKEKEYSDNFTKGFENEIKTEIKNKVRCKKYITPISTYKNKYTPYNWDYDYCDEYGYDTSYYNNEVEINIPDTSYDDYFAVTIYKNTKKEDFRHVSEVFTDKEVNKIVDNGLDDLKNRYKWDRRFAGYAKNDWEDLYDAVCDYYVESFERSETA